MIKSAEAKLEHGSLTSSSHTPLGATVTGPVSASATPTAIQNTPSVALSWNATIQLFYKLPDGTIKFREFDGSNWLGQSATIFKARADSGIAAIGVWWGSVRLVYIAFITRLLPILTPFFRYECIPWVKEALWRSLLRMVQIYQYGGTGRYPTAATQPRSHREVTWQPAPGLMASPWWSESFPRTLKDTSSRWVGTVLPGEGTHHSGYETLCRQGMVLGWLSPHFPIGTKRGQKYIARVQGESWFLAITN